MRFWIRVLLYGVLYFPATAFAADIPLDGAAFTTFIQGKLQLYSAAPVRVTGPFAVAIGAEGGANLVFDFKPLHDACVSAPAQCEGKVHDYVQGVVARFPSANHDVGNSEAVPADQSGFMAFLADELGRLVPGDRLEVDGMTLNVTRPGGHAIAFDQRGYYQICLQAGFICATALRQSLERTAAWLAPADPARLRASLHVIAGCAAAPCEVAPSREPMAPFSRYAFANLEEVCFKDVAGGVVPMTNADRRDAGLDIEAAFTLCEKSTRDLLPSLPRAPVGAAEIGSIAAPYAASLLLFPADWPPFVQAWGGHLSVAVPSRDLILYVTSDEPAQLSELGAHARSAFASASSLALSPDVYRWTGNGWEIAAAPPPAP